MAKKINKRKLKKYFAGGEVLGLLKNPLIHSAAGFSSSLVANEIGNAIDIYKSTPMQQLNSRFKPTQNTGYSFALGTDGTETSDVEVEGGEYIKTPEGETATIQGPDHEQGGVPMELPVGTEVYSKRLRHPQTGETMASRAENRESRLKEAQRKFVESKGDYYQKKALQRAKQINKLEEEEDMAIQQYFQAMAEQQEENMQYEEEIGGEEETQQFSGGGRVKATKYSSKEFGTGFTLTKPEGMKEDDFQKWLDDYGKENLVTSYKNKNGKINYKPKRDLNSPEEYEKYLLQLADIQYKNKDYKSADNTFKLYEQTASTISNPKQKQVEQPMSKSEADRRDYWEHNKRKRENPQNYVEQYNPKQGQTQADRFKELGVDPEKDFTQEEVVNPLNNTPSLDNVSTEVDPYSMTTGNMIGAGATAIKGLAPLLTTIGNKLSDEPLQNYWENFGAEAIHGLEENLGVAKQEQDRNIKDIQSSSLASNRGMRNNTRGINSLRALQFANDTKKQDMIEQATNAFNQRKMNLQQVLAQTRMNADRMRLMGRDRFDLATEQRNDNFWTNLGMNMVNVGNAVDNYGQSARMGERNKTLAQLTEDVYSEGNFGASSNAKVVNRFNTPNTNKPIIPTTSDEEELYTDEELLPIELTVNGKKEVYANPKAKKQKLSRRQKSFIDYEEEADEYFNNPENILPDNYVKPTIPTYTPEVDEIAEKNRKSTRPTTFKRRR